MELSTSSKQKYNKLDENPEEGEEFTMLEQNHYVPTAIQRHSRDNIPTKSRPRRNSRFRISQSEVIENQTYAGAGESPKLFTVPLASGSKNKVVLFSCDFPIELRGYVSASFYAEVVSTLNHYREGLSKAGIILPKPRKAKIFSDIHTYIDTINNYSRHIKWAVDKHTNEKYDFGLTIEVNKPRSINFTAMA